MIVAMAPTTTRPPIVPPMMAGVLLDLWSPWVAERGVDPRVGDGLVVWVVVSMEMDGEVEALGSM